MISNHKFIIWNLPISMGNSWWTALHLVFRQIFTLISTFLKHTEDVIKKAVPSLPECLAASPSGLPHKPQFSFCGKKCVGHCKSTPLFRSSICLSNSGGISYGIQRIGSLKGDIKIWQSRWLYLRNTFTRGFKSQWWIRIWHYRYTNTK